MLIFTSSFGAVSSELLLPISQFASLLNGTRNISTKNKCKKSEDFLYNFASFNQLCEHLDVNLYDPHLKDVIKSLRKSYLYCPTYNYSNWKISHKSTDSFFENKHGVQEPLLLQPQVYPLLRRTEIFRFNSLSSSVNSHNLLKQCRGFKTKTKREIEGLGLSSTLTDRSSLGGRFLGFRKKEQDKVNIQIDIEQREKLKTLLQDDNLPKEDQKRLLVAFAEGYLAAEPRTRTSSKLKVFSFFRDVFGIIFILAILLSIIGGPFRRVLIGSVSEVHPEEIDVTFDDVKGVDEAKQELQEIVEFLRNPEKFSSLGGKLPKGALLVGPPGTGKTLLARAVAGEAHVPFFHAAGPEFDEILVGQGARRVRDLFHTAKIKAPCVIFIDEIDSVGAKRTNSVLHPYANQTINQLLTEMDGFRQNEGVIVLGATNRRDDLDKALLRPGRFDVEVHVSVPDLNGRKEILELYLGKIKLAGDVSVDVLGRGTTGFTGADIENMVNQAALRAAIEGAKSVSMSYLENSRDKVLMGPERKSRIPDEEANTITAYHEGGHALVSYYTKDAQPLHKVTIIPRGPSLGHTAYIPEKEHYHVTKSQMLATMDTLMGGRAAEELIFGPEKITSGASSDLKQATALATNMVKEWGMSDKVGVRTFGEEKNSLVVISDLASSTSEAIDSEIKRILNESFERAKSILRTHSKEHKLLAEALLKYETLGAEDIRKIICGKSPSSAEKIR